MQIKTLKNIMVGPRVYRANTVVPNVDVGEAHALIRQGYAEAVDGGDAPKSIPAAPENKDAAPLITSNKAPKGKGK